MRYIRYCYQEQISYGLLEGDVVKPCLGSPETGGLKPIVAAETLRLDQVTLLAPLRPGKMVCVGLNYLDHIQEFHKTKPAEPVLFIKPLSALLDPGQAIVRPPESSRVDYEGELVTVIGRRACRVSPAEAQACIWGYTCGNDVTARDLQPQDGQWTRAKGFDTFAPLGPWVETALDPADLAIRTYLNGKLVQNSRTSYLLFKPDFLVSYISHVMTLNPGDVIFTGTSSGVGPMQAGDRVAVEIEGLGRLENPVVDLA
ncbi:MAG: fumarylacetoacetate hydrolase family protein [Oscillospiraceae bacterium]|nr:fumarylacetoacetate hydrolase family protein [Oscillospiraceae bacterium]MDD4367423.1 fumarylacetoacetate hydrolase family protein [Oscillospiraceae bacterium]